MNRTVKIVGWIVVAMVAFWLLLQVISAIFSFVTWVVSMLITLLVVGVLLFAAYVILSKVLGGGSGSGTRSTERERIFE